ncbi:MAG: hypothetical protein JWO38_689 [Gemmataceae bacterium]|nr:hypothetical protein [Gemmataceae bacterium]
MSHDTFLHRLRAQPDDDTLRLVYADWLDDLGDVRGEFLRTAVALRAAPDMGANIPALRQRLRELRAGVPAEWLVQAVRSLAEDEVREAVFRELLGEDTTGSFLQIEDRQDPSWYLFDRLADVYTEIRPVSAAERRDGGLFDTRSGNQLNMLRIDALRWVAQGRCDVGGGWFWDGLAATGNLYRVELKDGSWVVLDTTMLWIS